MANWKDFLDPDARGGRFLPWKEVARATGLSRTTAWRLQKRREFPAPYAISPGRVGYREEEVEAWRVSRGHSARRASASPTRAAAPMDTSLPGPAAASATPPPRSATAQPPERPKAPEPAAQTEPRPGSTRVAPHPPTVSAKARRRRSQHAQAIAQQMLFDF